MYFLGLDIGSSFIKVSVFDAENSRIVHSATLPGKEMKIIAQQKDWAEQHPEKWWEITKDLIRSIISQDGGLKNKIKAIGITYQMHGLVAVDKNINPVRPSIIWCDSRASKYGQLAFEDLGNDFCLSRFHNSPGNFTASKLKWIKENDAETYNKIFKILLPGDFIAAKLTGEICTTLSGLSEGIFWDFKDGKISDELINYYGFEKNILPEVCPTFGDQGIIKEDIAAELGLQKGIPITYRAGDQPNNAFSLNVMKAGDIAANAGTSGVLFAISEGLNYDPKSRVNSFAHVNYSTEKPVTGILMCINGTGIANAWIKNNCNGLKHTYEEMNQLASKVKPGSEGIQFIPFGNGSERILENKTAGCSIHGLSFNMHNEIHLFRAVQEGIACSFNYGYDILKEIGINPKTIKASKANLFQSELFCEILASITGSSIELFNTDSATGAAKGAALGLGYYKSLQECNKTLEKIKEHEPVKELQEKYSAHYDDWKRMLLRELK